MKMVNSVKCKFKGSVTDNRVTIMILQRVVPLVVSMTRTAVWHAPKVSIRRTLAVSIVCRVLLGKQHQAMEQMMLIRALVSLKHEIKSLIMVYSISYCRAF